MRKSNNQARTHENIDPEAVRPNRILETHTYQSYLEYTHSESNAKPTLRVI